jgi:hypothetical protein
VDDDPQELMAVASDLEGGVACAVRGDGAGQFVFAERGSRAVEVSRNGSAWWVEFRAGGNAVLDRTFPSAEEAVVAARAWLAVRKA